MVLQAGLLAAVIPAAASLTASFEQGRAMSTGCAPDGTRGGRSQVTGSGGPTRSRRRQVALVVLSRVRDAKRVHAFRIGVRGRSGRGRRSAVQIRLPECRYARDN